MKKKRIYSHLLPAALSFFLIFGCAPAVWAQQTASGKIIYNSDSGYKAEKITHRPMIRKPPTAL